MVNISLWVSGAVTRRSRLIDRGSLLPPTFCKAIIREQAVLKLLCAVGVVPARRSRRRGVSPC